MARESWAAAGPPFVAFAARPPEAEAPVADEPPTAALFRAPLGTLFCGIGAPSPELLPGERLVLPVWAKAAVANRPKKKTDVVTIFSLGNPRVYIVIIYRWLNSIVHAWQEARNAVGIVSLDQPYLVS